MNQTAVSSATRLSRIAGPVCMTRVAMRPAKSFWKNAQDCAHDVPVVLPADAVGDVGGDRLVHHQMLGDEGERAQHQQHGGHAGKHRPGLGAAESPASVLGDQRHDLADEHRDGDVEQRDDKADGEQAEEQALRLAGEMPIERHQPGRRHRLLGDRRGLQQAFEKAEHDGQLGGDKGRARRLGAPRTAGSKVSISVLLIGHRVETVAGHLL